MNQPDWERLAGCGLTLVIYMGLARLAEIVPRLRAGGLPADTPAAVIARATLPDECAMLTTLGDLPVAAPGVAGPAILVVGEVVRLADRARAPGRVAEAA